MSALTLVFVHGYSVSNLDTYGELPLRLKNEASLRGISISIQDIFLGRYISFNDMVRLADVSKALQLAIKEQIPEGTKFVCVTHSTGAPVLRTWLHLFYKGTSAAACPLSHLIMLAPANHGSALAQLGKTRLSRIKSWFDGIEPGQRILDWLELGSEEAWQLNKEWILTEAFELISKNIFPFVLSGQDIDRKLYDHINSYTGEAGSDGVVRLASANLNSRYLKLEQSKPQLVNGKLSADLVLTEFKEAPQIALAILEKKSHSGDEMGILKSVKEDPAEKNSAATIAAIFDCFSVQTKEAYTKLCEKFEGQSADVQTRSVLEIEKKLLQKNIIIHDRYAMVIFRLRDNEGQVLSDFDLVLTAGEGNDPNNLPNGFFVDRQRNRLNQSTLSFYFNYDLMIGSKALSHEGEMIRRETNGIKSLGFAITPRPEEGFVRYLPCSINASEDFLKKILKPNTCTMVDITLFRVLSSEVFRFEKPVPDQALAKNFKNTKPGDNFVS